MTARRTRWMAPLLAVAVLVTAAAAWAGRSPDAPHVIMFKNAQCECCLRWASLLTDAGFTVDVRIPEDLGAVAAEHGVPAQLMSCHVALVDGYVVVGHVPIAEVQRLLRERPQVAGISVPGMVAGSPGMGVAGPDTPGYDVLTFDQDGKASVYARY
jgi:hypothetical protein